MNIYERDYTKLTPDERAEWDKKLEEEKVIKLGDGWIRKSLFSKYPKAARHYMSLFPNHYLDFEDLQKEDELTTLVEGLKSELDKSNVNERAILNYIRDNKAYFIIASILTRYRFGHHEAYIMPEFKLGSSYQVDFLLVGRGSGGYEFIFVELEAPNGRITRQSGLIGDAFRKGIEQVESWERWVEVYHGSFKESFMKIKHPEKPLPEEFTNLDTTRYHYVVVAGRREDFNETTYYTQRKASKRQNIELLHYDNLYDSAKNVIGRNTY